MPALPAYSPKDALAAEVEAEQPAFALGALDGALADWQQRLRAQLWSLLGGPAEPVKPDLELDAPQTRDGYSLRRLTFASRPGVRVPALLLTPDAGRRRAGAVLALHGHGAGKEDPAGEGEAERIAQSAYDYGALLARRGHLVLIPDARGFGERSDGTERGCHVLGLASLLLGRPIAGQRLRDDIAALSLLRSLSGSPRLGVVGLSEGGKRTLLLAACDERVTAAVCSGYFTRIRDEIANWERLWNWDICNALPGLLAVADLPEIAALMAPRALCIDWGREDGLYSPAAVTAGAEAVAGAYASAEATDRFWLHAFDGGHRFGGEPVLDWLQAQLAR